MTMSDKTKAFLKYLAVAICSAVGGGSTSGSDQEY